MKNEKSKHHPIYRYAINAKRAGEPCYTAWAKTNDRARAEEHFEYIIECGHQAQIAERVEENKYKEVKRYEPQGI